MHIQKNFTSLEVSQQLRDRAVIQDSNAYYFRRIGTTKWEFTVAARASHNMASPHYEHVAAFTYQELICGLIGSDNASLVADIIAKAVLMLITSRDQVNTFNGNIGVTY